MTASRKYIISASRRNDCVASDPERLAAILRGEKDFTRMLRHGAIHTLLISTKDPRNLVDNAALASAVLACEQICINLTVTGLGGDLLEPHAPAWTVLRNRMPEIVKLVGSGERITWCFDPVLSWHGKSNLDLDLFESLAGDFAAMGVSRVFAMFYRPYRNSMVSIAEPPEELKIKFAARCDAIAQQHGLLLSFCHIRGLHRCKCVDLSWLCHLHPTQDTLPAEHYRRVKRPDASYCRDAIWDVGWYLPACTIGCRYCYAAPLKNARSEKAATPSSFPDFCARAAHDSLSCESCLSRVER